VALFVDAVLTVAMKLNQLGMEVVAEILKRVPTLLL
jgi:hypothetical protein